MANVLRTIIVPANQVGVGRQLGVEIDPHGHGMFTTALSTNGLPPASHYVSSGIIQEEFAAVLNDGLLLHAAAVAGAKAQGIPKVATQADAEGLPPSSIVHDGFHPDTGEPETPHQLFARLGLKIINEGIA